MGASGQIGQKKGLEARDLSMGYNVGKTVVNGIDLRVEPGEVIVLLGTQRGR